MKTKTAKQQLKSCRLFKVICFILVCTAFGLFAWFSHLPSIVVVLIALAGGLIFGVWASIFANKKWIISTLIQDLDAPLYYEIVKTGRFYSNVAIDHLQAEFFMGNYSNVVAICNQKLADPKIAKKYGYIYISYLARVYFRTGDNARLQQACEQMQAFLATAKSKPSKNVKAFIEVIQFYRAYLLRDWDACEKWLDSNPPKTEFARVDNDHTRARVALEKGEIDKAKELFQAVVQRAPKLSYATHAAHALEAIEANRPYSEGIEPVVPNESFTLPIPPKSSKGVAVLIWVIFFIVILRALWTGWQEIKWEREYEEYLEELRVMVEVDHDNVTVAQEFDLMYRDEIVDSMFVCEVDSGMILAASYVYTGEEELHYDTLVTISKEDLQSEEPLRYIAEFESVTSYINVVMGFYTQREDLPESLDVYYATVHGKSVYMVVISMEEIPH